MKSGSNSVRPTGSHVSGSGTLTNAGTKAPQLKKGTVTGHFGGEKSNSIHPNSPIGGPTFGERPASHIKFDARKVVGEAHANQRAGYSKQLSQKVSGPFKGGTTAGNRAKAENYSNGLKGGYGK